MIEDIRAPAPLAIEANANLTEAAHIMLTGKAKRMAVMKPGEVVGVIREQDLFFEIDRILGQA